MRLSRIDAAVVTELLSILRDSNRELASSQLFEITRRTLTARINRARTEILDLTGTLDAQKLAALLREHTNP